jgi:uncharacterized membrane protein HdeD (DUF308 family)
MGDTMSGLMLSGLVSGAIIMANVVAGLFFLKFWSQSQDRLFLLFALAFWILGVQRVLLALFVHQPDAHPYLYLLRLLGFLLIIFAIIDKNRPVQPSG